MTNLRYWFTTQSPQNRKLFITNMIYKTGKTRKTIYSYLDNQAPKLIDDEIVRQTNGELKVNQLYNNVKLINHE